MRSINVKTPLNWVIFSQEQKAPLNSELLGNKSSFFLYVLLFPSTNIFEFKPEKAAKPP